MRNKQLYNLHTSTTYHMDLDVWFTVHLSITLVWSPTWCTNSFISSNLMHNSYINSTKFYKVQRRLIL